MMIPMAVHVNHCSAAGLCEQDRGQRTEDRGQRGQGGQGADGRTDLVENVCIRVEVVGCMV